MMNIKLQMNASFQWKVLIPPFQRERRWNILVNHEICQHRMNTKMTLKHLVKKSKVEQYLENQTLFDNSSEFKSQKLRDPNPKCLLEVQHKNRIMKRWVLLSNPQKQNPSIKQVSHSCSFQKYPKI